MIETIFELKYEKLDEKIIKKLNENKLKFKNIEKEKIIEKIQNKSEKEIIEKLINEIENYNNIKNLLIMKTMYEEGFKDGVNLILDCKTK